MSRVKNVEAMARLLGFCNGFGGNYNPVQQNLQVVNLQTLLANATGALNTVSHIQRDYDVSINQRRQQFDKMPDLVSRIRGELKSCGASALSIADAETLFRKLSGRVLARAVASGAPGETENTVTKPRARGLDYPTLAFQFGNLVDLLKKEPFYNPSAEAIKISALENYVSLLHVANDTVLQRMLTLAEVRKQCVRWFNGVGGIYGTAMQVKQQVLAAYGSRSPEFRQVRSIRFTKK